MTRSDSIPNEASLPTLPVQGTVQQVEAGMLVGDRYRTVQWLGRGGMGSVYQVEDLELGIAVALKMVEGSLWDAVAVAQLKREIQLARRVTHPNVCRVHDFGVHRFADGESTPFLTMELLRGETLASYLRRKQRLPAQETLHIAQQMAAALDAAHAAGVVHRDFKTGNCMLVGDRAIVTDFGLAIEAASSDEGAPPALVGSPAYMAPEQVRGMPVTVASDVYAFGIVLYELVTGRVPFTGATATATAIERLHRSPAPPRTLATDLDPEWEQVILRCLRVDPDGRFESCGDVVRALSARASLLEIDTSRDRRSVALVLADGVLDPTALAASVRSGGGTLVTLGAARAAALFGAERSIGDEIERALATAQGLGEIVSRVAIGVGYATLRGDVLGGDALEEAEHALPRADAGLVAGARAAAALASRCELGELEPGIFALGALRQRTEAPLVGRTAELSTLRRARDAVRDEHRILASWITGPAGSGKSRLADAVTRMAAETAMTLRSARALPYDARALGLFLRALSREGHEIIEGASITPGRTPARGIDAQALADRLRSDVLGKLSTLLERGPLVLVLDDLQWADAASLALLEELPGLLGDVALWLVLVARDELVEARPELLGSFEAAGRIEPSPLRAGDVAELLRTRTGKAPSSTLAQALADRTGGNPLFVEQLIAVLDARALEEGTIDEWPVPASVEHAVQSRLDQLPAPERECIRRLAVWGRPASATEIEALGVSAADALLSSLTRRSLLARTTIEGQRAYRLRSPVIGEVAYRLLDAERRRELHRVAAELGRTQHAAAEEIARHLEEAGDRAAAAPLFAQAVLESAERGDSRGVLRCAERAMSCGLAPEQAFAVHFARVEAAFFVRDPALQKRVLTDAWASAQGDRERALVASEEGEWLRRNRRLDEALAQLGKAVTWARASADDETRARAIARLASTLITLGRTREASAALAELQALETTLSAGTKAFIDDVRGYLAGSAGDLGARSAAYASAAALYAESGDLRRAAGAESNRADADNRLGRFDEAERALARALELARKVGNRLTEGYALLNLGYALTGQGRNVDALAVLADSQRIAAAIGDAHLQIGAQLYTARARLPAADPELALSLEKAAGDAGDVTLEINARALAARAWLALPDVERALAQARAALALRDARGAVEEGEGDVFWSAVQALGAAGLEAEADAVRARGRARVLELADQIADPEARRSFLEQVPEHRALTAQ